MTRFTTHVLAEFVRDLVHTRLDDEAISAAKNALLDLLGCAAAGYHSPAAGAVRRAVSGAYAKGEAEIWFSGEKMLPHGAALANSTAASALDLDDGHRRAGGHPGAAMVPAVLAAGPNATGKQIMAALLAGYEVGTKVAAARDLSRLDTFSTGRWCAYGAAAAAGLLAGDDPEVLATAFSIAGVLSPGLSAAGYSKIMGNQVKEGIPWAVMTGFFALDLARQGLTGPLDILDHPDYFDAAAITKGLGSNPPALAQVYFKPYACCRWIHAALDALLDLREQHALDADHIRAMEVHTFERALRLSNETDPDSLEGAQYSLPFCLALAARHGGEALLPFDATRLHGPEVIALARRVNLHMDDELDALFPGQAGARLCLETVKGPMEAVVHHPLGDVAHPMGKDRLLAKFSRLASNVISPENQNRLVQAIEDLPDLPNMEPILACLKKP